MTIDYRPEDPAVLNDPFPVFAQMRAHDPVHWNKRLKCWVLTRYDDVKQVLLDKEMSSDRLRPFFASMPGDEAKRIGDIIRYLSLWMVFKDPPEHTRLRRMAGKVFNVKSMQGMRAKAEEISAWLLEAVAGETEFDLIADYAGPLPCLVIMAMMGAPREDLASLKHDSDEMALFIGSAHTSADKYDIAQAATHRMAEYFRHLIAARRAHPENDLLSELVNLRDGEDRLNDDELIGTCILLLFAGHETTTNLIANGMLSLARFPGEQRRLRADPSLTNAAVEELLRYDGPVGAQARIVTRDHEMRGKDLKAGDRVFIMLNSANRDHEAYPDADTLRLDRDGVPHLAFGFGAHICLGFPLARMEGQVALPALLKRYRSIEPATEALEWTNSFVLRGMKSLPVRARRT